jgi:hypothetical protein
MLPGRAGRTIADRRSDRPERDAAAPLAHPVGHLNLPHGLRAADQASELFRQHILQDMLIEAEIRDELVELAVLILDLLQAPQLAGAELATEP